MKVSILTPTRNNSDTLAQAIDSVLMQDYPEIEYIVVDGESDDESRAIIESYGEKISKVIYKRSDSPCEAMNYSLLQASGDIVGSVFGDDFLVDDSIISKVVECFRDESIHCVYGDMVFVDRYSPGKVIRYWKSSEYRDDSFEWGWHPTWVATFYRKAVFDKFGYLNRELKIACDYEFMLRTIHKNKIKTRYLPEVIIHMRAGGSSNIKFKNLIYANYESCKAWSLNKLKMPTLFFLYKPASKIYQYFVRP